MARGTVGSGLTDTHPLKVRISFLLGTSKCQTGFTLKDTSLTPINPQDAAEKVAEWVQDSFKTLFGTTDRFEGVDVVDEVTGEGGSVSFANLTGTVALTAADYTPSYITVPISMKGELRRRYGQGRMLWPMRHEGWQNGDVLNATGIAAFQGVMDNLAGRFLGDSGSTDYKLINAHGLIPAKAATATSPARPEVPPSWYDVTTLRLNSVLSFLRSRKAGVGS